MKAAAAVRRSPLVVLHLRTDRGVPLYRQIYREMRRRILEGVLAPNAPVPSVRALARDLRVSCSTVVQAYTQLQAEGYLAPTARSATRVSANVPQRTLRPDAGRTGSRPDIAIAPPSRRGQAIASHRSQFMPLADRPARAFRTSVPALDVFPMDLWGKLMARRWRKSPAAALSYSEPRGHAGLRTAIADYLVRARGVVCTADQVIVTSGSQQALDLVARVLLDPGDRVWMEDPGYFGASGAFTAAGARVVPVPVDNEGLDVRAGTRRAPRARLAFVTASRQMPLGVSLSLRRRLALLAWAKAHRAFVLEDDYDSEFRYASPSLASLQGIDENGCVVFMGTFSKVMSPALRLGYVVVPAPLVGAFATARVFLDFCPPYLTQAVMADFIAEGYFERHIRRMRAIYHSRQRLLIDLLRREAGEWLRVEEPEAGMNLMAWLPEGTEDHAVSRALGEAGIDALPISSCVLEHRRPPGLLLGYSGIRPVEIRDGVVRLARVLRTVLRKGAESR